MIDHNQKTQIICRCQLGFSRFNGRFHDFLTFDRQTINQKKINRLIDIKK